MCSRFRRRGGMLVMASCSSRVSAERFFCDGAPDLIQESESLHLVRHVRDHDAALE